MHDIKDRFRFDPASFDLVHARSITLAVRPSFLISRPSH